MHPELQAILEAILPYVRDNDWGGHETFTIQLDEPSHIQFIPDLETQLNLALAAVDAEHVRVVFTHAASA